MAYLPHTPRNFRELVLADLLRAQRLIECIDDEIDPQFRISSPEGDWRIAMTLAEDLHKRQRQMHLISRFMQWKLSPAFTLATELKEPDTVCCVGVSHRECHGVLSHISRKPLQFSRESWLTRDQIGDDVPAMLPGGAAVIDASTLAELDAWFGACGKFPAMKIGND